MKTTATAIIAFATFTSPGEIVTKQVNTSNSDIIWKGHKLGGSHEGTISIESGTLDFDGEKLVGGNFVIDMSSITVTDLDGDNKASLEGHLKSDDFFGVDTYNTADLEFTSVSSKGNGLYKVTGDLTIKKNTHPITFDLKIDGNKATTALKVDRSKFDVRYGSKSFFNDLKDKAIYDDFDLAVELDF